MLPHIYNIQSHIKFFLCNPFGKQAINLVWRDEQIEELKGIGADEVVNYTKDNAVKRVTEVTSGSLAYAAIDSAGGDVTKVFLGMRALLFSCMYHMLGHYEYIISLC